MRKFKGYEYFCLNTYTSTREHQIRCKDMGENYECRLRLRNLNTKRMNSGQIGTFNKVLTFGTKVTAVPSSDLFEIQSTFPDYIDKRDFIQMVKCLIVNDKNNERNLVCIDPRQDFDVNILDFPC